MLSDSRRVLRVICILVLVLVRFAIDIEGQIYLYLVASAILQKINKLKIEENLCIFGRGLDLTRLSCLSLAYGVFISTYVR